MNKCQVCQFETDKYLCSDKCDDVYTQWHLEGLAEIKARTFCEECRLETTGNTECECIEEIVSVKLDKPDSVEVLARLLAKEFGSNCFNR
jgi:hypothetical protein